MHHTMQGVALPFAMSAVDWEALPAVERLVLTQRPRVDLSATVELVTPLIERVRTEGNKAVLEMTATFDKVVMKEEQLLVDVDSLPWPKLDSEVQAAFDMAYTNIRRFHEAQRREPLTVMSAPGVECKRVTRPIDRVGLYVPGGTAVLPSTALMLGVPAQIAGSQAVLATPPRPDGTLCPEVVYCAKKCGVWKMLKAGGAQAVAAMAYGTQTVPKVNKILGPGNQFVTAAKMKVQTCSVAGVAIDMPAGPSEQLCVFTPTSCLTFVVADLLSQAEHGPDSQVVGILISADKEVGRRCLEQLGEEISRQVAELSREEIVKGALSKSFVMWVPSRADAESFSNMYAPEHLVLALDDEVAYNFLDNVKNAGSVFVGHLTPESAGDYASGTNHCLPTSGYAKAYSGVSLDSFLKYITVQRLTEAGLRMIGPAVEKMAEVEGLTAHKHAVSVRLDSLYD